MDKVLEFPSQPKQRIINGYSVRTPKQIVCALPSANDNNDKQTS